MCNLSLVFNEEFSEVFSIESHSQPQPQPRITALGEAEKRETTVMGVVERKTPAAAKKSLFSFLFFSYFFPLLPRALLL